MSIAFPGARAAVPLVGAGVLVFIAAGRALAQQAMYTEAATMPSPGTGVVREQVHYSRYGANPNTDVESTDRLEALTTISYGLARDFALSFDIPVITERNETPGGDDRDEGVGDLNLTLKWRFLKEDTGGIDTLRGALLAGASFGSGDDPDFSSQSVNPHIGVAFTAVRGRNGFDQDFQFVLNTGGTQATDFGGDGPSDAIRHNTAYLFRIAPAEYTSESSGAWYVSAELNGLYETDGDYDLRFSPGLMYEGRQWALEFMAQVPVYEHVNHRPELQVAVGVGIRISF